MRQKIAKKNHFLGKKSQYFCKKKSLFRIFLADKNQKLGNLNQKTKKKYRFCQKCSKNQKNCQMQITLKVFFIQKKSHKNTLKNHFS
jgi:hypothetical protein